MGSTVIRFIVNDLHVLLTYSESHRENNIEDMEIKEFKKLFKKCKGITVDVSNYAQIINSLVLQIVLNTEIQSRERNDIVRRYLSQEESLSAAIKEAIVKKEKHELLQSVSVSAAHPEAINTQNRQKNGLKNKI